MKSAGILALLGFAGCASHPAATSELSIESALLVTRVQRYRAYTPAETDRVAPGRKICLYVEPRNFTLQRSGDLLILHLKYDWKLYDDQGVERPMPAWDQAPLEDREDRLSFKGPVAEFYQSFNLPIPVTLAEGRYRVNVTVTDAHTGKSNQASVPLDVRPVKE